MILHYQRHRLPVSLIIRDLFRKILSRAKPIIWDASSLKLHIAASRFPAGRRGLDKRSAFQFCEVDQVPYVLPVFHQDVVYFPHLQL